VRAAHPLIVPSLIHQKTVIYRNKFVEQDCLANTLKTPQDHLKCYALKGTHIWFHNDQYRFFIQGLIVWILITSAEIPFVLMFQQCKAQTKCPVAIL
jgi:hypothetical protein